MDSAFSNTLKAAISSFAGRIVLAVYTLVIVPVLPTVINAINEILGYNITSLQVTAYANKASLAIGGLVAIWLLNNGLFERAALKAKALIEAPQADSGDVKTDYIKGP